MLRPARTALLCLSLSACGTLASSGENDRDLPNNRTGPFRELTPAESGDRECVTDFNGSLDEPSAVALTDGNVMLYASRALASGRTIARVPLRGGLRATADPVNALTATRPWEGGAVASPSVVRTATGWLMAYAAGGAIGLARSSDGLTFTSDESPWFTGDPSAGELTPPSSPALLLTPDGALVLAYESAGAVWLARARTLTEGLVRIDADPSTLVRDPIVTAARPSGDAGLAASDLWAAGSVGDPSLDLETTSAGRPLWRVYFTGHTAAFASDGGVATTRSVGMAASFDGRTFQRFANPVFTLRADGNPSSPSLLVRTSTVTVLYVGARCDLARTKRGVKILVAPAGASLLP